ncbi:prolyl oligopeptidase family serine peptidase [Actinopolymorpha sp. B17G11]|uniref:S9 family peptidase n=1 Tax=Actinopolymorpha sp. B17G11 TaxID=3160861 RepID=UPI0032E3B3BA
MTQPAWVRRFRATDISFPRWARDAPHRCLYTSNRSGTAELYGWDRQEARHVQLTSRPEGTTWGVIHPDGESVWWFDDTAHDERGRWVRQAFDVSGAAGGKAEIAVPDLAPGYPVGLALGHRVAAVGMSERGGVRLHLHRFDSAATTTLYESARHAQVSAMSYDETLLAIEHSEHGDADYPAIRVLRTGCGTVVGAIAGELWDGIGRTLHAVAFAPCPEDSRLLLHHERSGRSEPMIWDLAADTFVQPHIDLPGELSASWYPDGSALLIRRHWHARDELYRYDLEAESLARVETACGVVWGHGVRPDGTVEYQWSAGDRPSAILTESGSPVLEVVEPAPPSAALDDAWVDGPGGRIHALVASPPAASGPMPTVFWLHGGPGGEMTDSFFPIRAAFVDAGFRVVHVNYRGSSGYGAAWRDALRPAPGLVELEDVAAVRDWAVDTGLSDPDRCVITGKSWGGYLTLLALGTQADRWAAGIADVPIGDLVALYEDEMEPVREYDRSLFGGSPEQIPDKWARSNPITYTDRVKAPLLVIASTNDPRCPIRSVDNYLARLAELGTPYEDYRFEAGHMSVVVEEQIKQMARQLDFLSRHLSGPPEDASSAPKL